METEKTYDGDLSHASTMHGICCPICPRAMQQRKRTRFPSTLSRVGFALFSFRPTTLPLLPTNLLLLLLPLRDVHACRWTPFHHVHACFGLHVFVREPFLPSHRSNRPNIRNVSWHRAAFRRQPRFSCVAAFARSSASSVHLLVVRMVSTRRKRYSGAEAADAKVVQEEETKDVVQDGHADDSEDELPEEVGLEEVRRAWRRARA